ncbi:DUF1934 domain-containing protein [Mesobacillus subterraneus]|uniref:DUF1934 domain-containing protein n=1 Tax=Mesobacillus subterraneus TaxID=285983 RepID=A0A3R9KVI6_9BACI|nr:DUF1934 domain-containing protein [Mesobacillus subterraneus]RSD27173.1 DUF1934 domain-containing protein [Mesobacillus subterraneus]
MSTGPAEQIPVKVTVKTVIYSGSEKETFELTTFGRYYKKANSSYLQYDEVMEEGDVHTTVKISGNEVLIMRSGAIKMRLHFLLNKKTPGNYKTPYGLLETSALTKRLDLGYNDEKHEGQVDLLYEMAIQGANAGTYHLTINFKEEGK